MIITGKSKVISFSVIDSTIKELKSLYIPEEFISIISNLTKTSDGIYYYKSSRGKGLINELIGSYLSKKIGLSTVDYQIGKREYDGALFALSKVFYEEGYRYQSILSFLEEHHYKNRFNMLGNPIFLALPIYFNMRTLQLYKGTPFYDNNLKLIAVDLKMAQHDRCKLNMQIKIDSLGNIDLAPIYDYEKAYSVYFDLAYANPFAFIRYTESTLQLLFYRYPELRDYVEFLRPISMEEILGEIEQEKQIQFTEEEKREYSMAQNQNDELINKVKVKTIF